MAGDGTDLRDQWGRFYRAKSEADIRRLIEEYPQDRSLYVDVLDLYEFDESFTRGLFSDPDRYLRAGADTLRDLHDSFNRVNVRLTNHPGLLGIDGLRSRHVSELVTVEGVVAGVGEIQSSVTDAVYECERCGHRVHHGPRYRLSAPGGCTECGADGSVVLDHERSTFVDVQRVDLQTPPDSRPDEDDPASIEAVVDDDLVATARPGDRLLATGVVRLERESDANRFDFSLDVISLDEEPGEGRLETDDVSTELREAIASRWELLTDG